jgi:hypothetical protein
MDPGLSASAIAASPRHAGDLQLIGRRIAKFELSGIARGEKFLLSGKFGAEGDMVEFSTPEEHFSGAFHGAIRLF